MKKSASYYASNPEAAAKKRKYQARYQKSPDRVAYRVELKRERRRRGIYGKGGPDMSHTASGKMTPEDPSSNRARNGHGKNGRYKADDSVTVGQLRADKKCGESGIAKGKKCSKRTAPSALKAGVIGGAVGLGVLGVGIAAMTRRRGGPAMGRGSSGGPPGIGRLAPRPTAGPPGGGGVSRVSVRDVTRPRAALPPAAPTPRTLAITGRPAPRALSGSTPRGLLSPAAPRLGKTRRMRLNTQAAERAAEQRIAQTAREEIRRIGQIGNTMAATGEATGMRLKTTVREVRLRLEAARRRFEPGYRAPGDGAKIPKALNASSSRALPPAQTPISSPIPFAPRPQAPERLRLGKTVDQVRRRRSWDGRR